MTGLEQKQIVDDLIDAVRRDIVANMYDLPSGWDSIELRQYIADRFARETLPMEGARLRNYRTMVARVRSL